jgi:hypothetical protein
MDLDAEKTWEVMKMCNEVRNTETLLRHGSEVEDTEKEVMTEQRESKDGKKIRRKRVTFYVKVPGSTRRKKVTFLARRRE